MQLQFQSVSISIFALDCCTYACHSIFIKAQSLATVSRLDESWRAACQPFGYNSGPPISAPLLRTLSFPPRHPASHDPTPTAVMHALIRVAPEAAWHMRRDIDAFPIPKQKADRKHEPLSTTQWPRQRHTVLRLPASRSSSSCAAGSSI